MAQRLKTAPTEASELPDLTAQQQEFVRHLLAGKTGVDAYRAAYDCSTMMAATIIAAASRLRAQSNISAWLAAGREAHLGTAVLTRESHMAELERLKEIALKTGNVGAAVQAEQLRGKVAGHQVDTVRDITSVDTVQTLKDIAQTSPDLAAALAAQHGIDWKADEHATKH
jgi:hypothetical protein